MQAYEKLGLFYLGKAVDPQSGEPGPGHLLYDSRDLVTHAVCVGMTGSGKTGLCVTLLEEALIDKIPVIAIDPKGDLSNLMLTFPSMEAKDLLPWVNPEEARRKDMTVEQYAEAQAGRWRRGLAEWDQATDRIRMLRDAADFALYTPGSTAGLPVSILDSFSAPAQHAGGDLDLLKDRISSTAAGILGLVGIQADPLRSREHILLANIIENAWLGGKSLTLGALIQSVQSPPMQRIGVFDLESFYPAADRMELAMTLNNILAAPGFETWMQGAPLDAGSLLYTPEGKPRLSIFSIAHLSDAERMFFVTMLFNQILGWMRSQPGTTSLRALVYMDEIFGFLPPVAEPPSKKPLMTMLKQARAFGLGVVLATQNPVDLDYKALSNTGTWFIGRLQTERDRGRLLDGLSSAAGGKDLTIGGQSLPDVIAGLKTRVFVMQNAREDEPVLFHTRWALSYLAGPLTRTQIRDLTAQAGVTAPAEAPAAAFPAPARAAAASAIKPAIPVSLTEWFAPAETAGEGRTVYHPFLYASGKVQLASSAHGIAQTEAYRHILELEPNMTGAPWERAKALSLEAAGLLRPRAEEGQFAPLPSSLLQARPLLQAQKDYEDFLYVEGRLTLRKSALFKVVSAPGESEREFRIRLQQLAREKRDFELDKLRRRYAPKQRSLERQLLRAEQRIEREKEQLGQQKVSTAISLGATLLGALMGRKAISVGTLGRAGTTARQASKIGREKQDIRMAEETIESVRQQIEDLEEQLQLEADQLAAAFDPELETLQEIVVKPTKSDILLEGFGILWVPFRYSGSGSPEPLFP